MKRRAFLKATVANGAVAVAATAGLLTPTRILAADWPARAFAATSETDAVERLFHRTDAIASDAIAIKAPMQANGDSVAVSVTARLANVEGIALVVQDNPNPLCTSVRTHHAGAFYSARIRMAKTSAVIAYVKAGGKLYSATTNVKVNIGGYGMRMN